MGLRWGFPGWADALGTAFYRPKASELAVGVWSRTRVGLSFSSGDFPGALKVRASLAWAFDSSPKIDLWFLPQKSRKRSLYKTFFSILAKKNRRFLSLKNQCRKIDKTRFFDPLARGNYHFGSYLDRVEKSSFVDFSTIPDLLEVTTKLVVTSRGWKIGHFYGRFFLRQRPIFAPKFGAKIGGKIRRFWFSNFSYEKNSTIVRPKSEFFRFLKNSDFLPQKSE